ncbi:FtsX-like permease family protein [Nocardioides sp.]|uniref:FtsX-like permease family protein n=1 Tax=Nocardioides sp. TaxID=35761 RepID=UPI003D13E73A
MLTLVLRRAFVQRGLLAAVVLLLTAAASLVGVCSLLLGVTHDRAFHEEAQRLQPRDVDVTAYLLDLRAGDLEQGRDQAQGVVRTVLAPTHPDVTTITTAPMRRIDGLDGTDRLGYLVSDDALAEHAVLTSGRWPAETGVGPVSAAVPQRTARLLGLDLGDRVTLGSEVGPGGVGNSITVVVVGTFRPRSTTGWETDPLSGAGFDPTYSNGTVAAPAFGPFAVADASFLATGSSASALRVTAHPDLSLVDEPALRAAVDSLEDASALLSSRVSGLAGSTRVGSDLPQTLDRVRTQQSATRATVLVVLLLATGLSVAAALLAGRLVASVREDERELLISLGLSRRQQVVTALLEAVLLATVAGLLAVPLAAVTHSRLTHLPGMRAAQLTQSPSFTWGLVLAALAGALLLTVVLVVTAQTALTAADPTARRWTLVRSGLDLLLVAVAVVGWWQLRSPPSTGVVRIDAMLTVAPVLCLAAATVVAVRLVPSLLGTAASATVRSPALIIPLAVQQAARRPRAGTAMVLLAAAVATAVFGLALQETWAQSQDDQAALRVGTDLSLTLSAPPGAQEAAAIASVAAAEPADRSPAPVFSVAVDRPLALGRFVGDADTRPVLVAVDTGHAGALLRGRLEAGTTWAAVGAELAPDEPVHGLRLPDDGTGIELRGTAPAGAVLTVTPTAVVQDTVGFRRSVLAGPLPLDGRSHPVEWLEPIGAGQRLLGLRLDVAGTPPGDPNADPGIQPPARVGVTLRLPGREVSDRGSWQAHPLESQSPVSRTTVSVDDTEDGIELRTTARIDLTYLLYSGASWLTTEFATPSEVPVAVSQELADAIGAKVGGTLAAVVEGSALRLVVTAIVPTVPSAPGQVAVLADADTVSRALIGGGSLDPVVDGWWVGHPTAELTDELRALDLGNVTTRDHVSDQLSQGPLRATVPAALLTLVLAAATMLLAGVVLVLSAERQARSAEVARLRALGFTRRDARRLLLAEYGAFLVPLVLVGTVVGAVAAVLLGPHLIRSDLGATPIPGALVAWPRVALGLLLGGLLLGSVVVTSVMTAHLVRRSDPADLRAGDL